MADIKLFLLIYKASVHKDMTIKLIMDEKYSTRVYPTSLFD
jgi:hypothetical protein